MLVVDARCSPDDRGPKQMIAPKSGLLPVIVVYTTHVCGILLVAALLAYSLGTNMWLGSGMSMFLYATLQILRITGDVKMVPVGQIGLLVTLGERRKEHFLSEGIHWLPPFTSLLLFDSKERRLEIPETEALSADSVPIRYAAQVRIRIVNPYNYSCVEQPEQKLLEILQNQWRSHFSSRSALEIAANGDLSDSVQTRISERALELGFGISPPDLTLLRLPPDLERLAQVLRVVRQEHPEISFRDAVDALQTNQGNVRKLVLESSTLESAVAQLMALLVR